MFIVLCIVGAVLALVLLGIGIGAHNKSVVEASEARLTALIQTNHLAAVSAGAAAPVAQKQAP